MEKSPIQQQNQELSRQNQTLTEQFQIMMEGIIKNTIEPLVMQNNYLIQQNKILMEQNKKLNQELQSVVEKAIENKVEPLVEEIKTLKAEQREIVKNAVAEAIKTQMKYLIDRQVEKLIEKINAQGDRLSDNQKELAKFLVSFQEDVKDYITKSEKSEKEMLEEGEKILDVLDDLGKGLINAHSGLTDLQNSWGETLGNALGNIGIGIKGLAERMDNAEKNILNNQEYTYKAVKSVDSLIHRKSW